MSLTWFQYRLLQSLLLSIFSAREATSVCSVFLWYILMPMPSVHWLYAISKAFSILWVTLWHIQCLDYIVWMNGWVVNCTGCRKKQTLSTWSTILGSAWRDWAEPKKSCQDSQYPGSDSNWAPPQYECGELQLCQYTQCLQKCVNYGL